MKKNIPTTDASPRYSGPRVLGDLLADYLAGSTPLAIRYRQWKAQQTQHNHATRKEGRL